MSFSLPVNDMDVPVNVVDEEFSMEADPLVPLAPWCLGDKALLKKWSFDQLVKLCNLWLDNDEGELIDYWGLERVALAIPHLHQLRLAKSIGVKDLRPYMYNFAVHWEYNIATSRQ